MAAALPIKPILEVFSRKWGVSDTMEPGIAIQSLFLVKAVSFLFLLRSIIEQFV
jgi:hypothetical protein